MEIYVLTIRSNGLVIDSCASRTLDKLLPVLRNFVQEHKIERVDPDGDFEQTMIDIDENIGGRGFEVDLQTMSVL